MNGLIIKQMREGLKLTQAEIAKRMGVSQPYVAQLEREDANPEFDTLKKLAKAMGCKAWELIDG